MKIQCLAVLLGLTCLTTGTASSVQVRTFMSQKAITNDHDGHDLVATEDNDKHESEPEPNSHKVETKTDWSGVSNINLKVTLIVAAIWVLTLGSAPVLIYYVGGKKVTKSAMILSGSMWVALFGGLYLFTQIILFNSPHFSKVRSLTIIECTYFMTQVITTVGYGDITPAMPRGQVFVGLYVTLSFFVIALLMSEMQKIVMERVNSYRQDLKNKFEEKVSRMRAPSSVGENEQISSSPSSINFKPEKPSPNGLISSLSAFASVGAIWVLFFHFYPGENKAWLEAIYMSLITLTTVGFGAITPVTEGGMLFAAFFMFIGTAALVNVVGEFSSYILEMDEHESWCPKEFQNGLKAFSQKYSMECGSGNISEETFLILALLQKKLVTEEQIDGIKETYKSMLGSKGKVNLKGIASKVSDEIDHADLGDSDTEAASSARASLPASAR